MIGAALRECAGSRTAVDVHFQLHSACESFDHNHRVLTGNNGLVLLWK